jgi:elongation factor Ts
MADITAALVRELREATNAGMMECKRALVEADGNKDEATRILRERGLAIASKKASRTANQGLVAAGLNADGTIGALVEVNCETDFVAKNETFQSFVADLACRAVDIDEGGLAEAVKTEVVEQIAKIGENIVVKRNTRLAAAGTGTVFGYVHLGGKIAVLVDVGCEKTETLSADAFTQLGKDLAMQVAAANPSYLAEDEIPKAVVDEERAILAKQAEGKPAEIVERIVDGKIRKFYAETCLVHQAFIKEPKQSVTELLTETGKTFGDALSIRAFRRYQIGQ